jgi:hypothetical protein
MGTYILIIACITALAGIIAHFKICCKLRKIYSLENCFQISHF